VLPFGRNVAFTGTTGELDLADAAAYSGSIKGFSKKGKTSLDLRDIGFVGSAEATFSGTTKGGVLTVTDGADTAQITFKGNYTASTWIASSDGDGGTLVIDQPTPAPTIRAHAFVSAMATVGPASGGGAHIGEVWSVRETLLVPPRRSIA